MKDKEKFSVSDKINSWINIGYVVTIIVMFIRGEYAFASGLLVGLVFAFYLAGYVFLNMKKEYETPQ